MRSVYTLQRGNKTVGIHASSKPLVIGFVKLNHVKAVHYNMHPDPETRIQVIKNVSEATYMLDGTQMKIIPESTLFIPKCTGDSMHPMNDGGFHLNTMKDTDFYALPLTHNVGIIVPYELVDEDEHEFMFRVNIMFRNE